MSSIAGVTGRVFQRPDKYDLAAYQYATSSYEDTGRMRPRWVIQPQSKEEIVSVLRYARHEGIAVAIRSGGHQYSGASSTSGRNIQLDLKPTFRTDDDRRYFEKDNKAFVRASVSWTLREFNNFLGEHHAFIPHGQCAPVCLGGHVQTGGYGQLGRSFGLLGDYVVSLEVIDHAGEFKEVTEDTDKDLFYAILGGSPGNLGVLTHFTLEVHRDSDYVGSKGSMMIYNYTPQTLKYLLEIVVNMSDNKTEKRNYDLCVTVVSKTYKTELLFPFSDEDAVVAKGHETLAEKGSIIVFAQWVPFGAGDDDPDVVDAWFHQFDNIPFNKVNPYAKIQEPRPMSELTKWWIFDSDREFPLPYIRRTQLTNSTSLKQNSYAWSNWLVGRIDELMSDQTNNLYLSAQIQPFGGENSKFITNGKDGTTAYSWREDTTIVMTHDIFYNPEPGVKEKAIGWQEQNDRVQIGSGLFSTQDRRVLWGSYGEFDLDSVWPRYYEDQAKYDKLRKARLAADPFGIFTPNEFSVKRAEAA